MDNRFMLLQINDALFPIGAFAHSYGLETYVFNGLVNTEETAERYIKAYIHNSLLYNELLAIVLAYKYVQNRDLPSIIRLEGLYIASKSCSEIREATRRLSQRFIKNINLVSEDLFWNEYVAAALEHAHTFSYGVWCELQGMELMEILEAYLYSQVSNMVTNCVKLIPLSQSQGQKILTNLHFCMREAINRVVELDEEDFIRGCPGMDIASMQHEVMYSRLYMS